MIHNLVICAILYYQIHSKWDFHYGLSNRLQDVLRTVCSKLFKTSSSALKDFWNSCFFSQIVAGASPWRSHAKSCVAKEVKGISGVSCNAVWLVAESGWPLDPTVPRGDTLYYMNIFCEQPEKYKGVFHFQRPASVWVHEHVSAVEEVLSTS